jgi:hypothetical protein
MPPKHVGEELRDLVKEMADYLNNISGFSASNKVNYADKRQKQNSKKSRTKAQPAKDDQSDDSFPVTNSTSNKGFSYCANHSIGETTMFPDVYYQTLQSYPNLENALGDGIYSARWITDMVAKSNVTPFFLPKSNVTFQTKRASR